MQREGGIAKRFEHARGGGVVDGVTPVADLEPDLGTNTGRNAGDCGRSIMRFRSCYWRHRFSFAVLVL